MHTAGGQHLELCIAMHTAGYEQREQLCVAMHTAGCEQRELCIVNRISHML